MFSDIFPTGFHGAVTYDKIDIAAAVNVQIIGLNDAARGYEEFDKGAAKNMLLIRMA